MGKLRPIYNEYGSLVGRCENLATITGAGIDLHYVINGAQWGEEKQSVSTEEEKDLVNHPPHYKRGGLEAIDVIEAFELDYHLGQVAKYILRAGHKDDLVQDLSKARWYLDRAIERAGGK